MTGAPLAFDFDGTLVDARPRQLLALHRSLAGAPVDDEAFWTLKRSGLSTAKALVRLGFDDDAARATAAGWVAIVEDDELLAVDPLQPTAAAALDRAGEHGSPPLLISARQRPDGLRAQLRRLGIDRRFAGVHVVEPARAAAAKAEVLRSHPVAAFVGDTESDGVAARSAGVLFFAVTDGQRSGDELARNGIVSLHPDVLTATSAALAAVR